jgi:hypothetical protein
MRCSLWFDCSILARSVGSYKVISSINLNLAPAYMCIYRRRGESYQQVFHFGHHFRESIRHVGQRESFLTD